jgi:hypothetical protein
MIAQLNPLTKRVQQAGPYGYGNSPDFCDCSTLIRTATTPLRLLQFRLNSGRVNRQHGFYGIHDFLLAG